MCCTGYSPQRPLCLVIASRVATSYLEQTIAGPDQAIMTEKRLRIYLKIHDDLRDLSEVCDKGRVERVTHQNSINAL